MFQRMPIHDLPAGYHEVRHLVATERRTYLWLNAASVIPFTLGLVLMGWWWAFVRQIRGPYPSAFWEDLSWAIGAFAVLVVMMAAHEWAHGLAIQAVGYRPRYGIKLDQGVIYATTDGGLFRRSEFIFVALAPLVLITLIAMTLMIFVPDALGYYLGLLAVFNAAGAAADLWMAWVVRRYPVNALVRDEADSIRIYCPVTQTADA